MAAQAASGAILCLHDGRELRVKPDTGVTVEAVRRLVPLLLDQGYRFETVTPTYYVRRIYPARPEDDCLGQAHPAGNGHHRQRLPGLSASTPWTRSRSCSRSRTSSTSTFPTTKCATSKVCATWWRGWRGWWRPRAPKPPAGRSVDAPRRDHRHWAPSARWAERRRSSRESLRDGPLRHRADRIDRLHAGAFPERRRGARLLAPALVRRPPRRFHGPLRAVRGDRGARSRRRMPESNGRPELRENAAIVTGSCVGGQSTEDIGFQEVYKKRQQPRAPADHPEDHGQRGRQPHLHGVRDHRAELHHFDGLFVVRRTPSGRRSGWCAAA